MRPAQAARGASPAAGLRLELGEAMPQGLPGQGAAPLLVHIVKRRGPPLAAPLRLPVHRSCVRCWPPARPGRVRGLRCCRSPPGWAGPAERAMWIALQWPLEVLTGEAAVVVGAHVGGAASALPQAEEGGRMATPEAEAGSPGLASPPLRPKP